MRLPFCLREWEIERGSYFGFMVLLGVASICVAVADGIAFGEGKGYRHRPLCGSSNCSPIAESAYHWMEISHCLPGVDRRNCVSGLCLDFAGAIQGL